MPTFLTYLCRSLSACCLSLSAIAPCGAAIIDACCEDLAEARSFQSDRSKGGAENNRLETVADPVRAGRTAFRHTITTNGERSELAMDKTRIGGTYWYGWSLLLPTDFDLSQSHSIVMQLATFPTPRTGKFPCGANGSYLEVGSDGRLVFVLQHQGDVEDSACERFRILDDVRPLRGRWIDFVMHARWTGDPDGFMKFWVKSPDAADYEQRIDYTGRTFWNDEGDGPYFKMGIYTGNPGWKGPPQRTVYTDEYRLGDATSSFAEVAPGGNPARPSAQAEAPFDNLAREQLVAWCIVPFDSQKRSPAERAEMVHRLGLRRVAYDWRAEHVPQFEQEILEYQRHGIEFFAFWGTHDEAFRLFAQYDLHPQIWQMVVNPPGGTDAERLAAAVEQLRPLVGRTRAAGCRLGLYNHGGWGGEPANLVAMCRALREQLQAEHVGIVYNLHHGHGHIDDFTESLALMQPYLLCLNLNGMTPGGDTRGLKILPVGAGEEDLRLLKIIRDSNYRGPIGIIGHTQDDVEQRLLDNLDGLDWLRPQLDGRPPQPGVQYRTWAAPQAQPTP